MASPRIQTLGGLKQYILRKLGYPLHQIEITDDQLDDAISDTLDDYTQCAYAGVTERFVGVQLLKGVQDYVLPYSVFAVLSVNDSTMSMIGANMPSNMFSLNQFIAADLYKPGVAKIDMVGYEMIQQMTASLDLIFAKKQTFDFNSISKILHIHGNITDDTKVVMQVYQKLELDTTPVSAGASTYEEEKIYDDKWVKRMCTARAKLQWGVNIGLKYQGSVLPNGGSINGQGIIDMATAEIEALTAELHDVYELPIDFFIG
jgi:hypothetical protein